MTLELRVLSGALAGRQERFQKPVVVVGRHPQSDLRFDPELDRDVSARHAEIRRVEGRYRIVDAGSTNGTFVNGARIASERELRAGDVISFGEHGPRVEVRLAPRQPDTNDRIAASVRRHTARLRYALLGITVLLVGTIGATYAYGRREARVRSTLVDALGRRTDSLTALYGQDIQRVSGQVFGLDSALTSARIESERLRAELAQVRSGAPRSRVAALATRLEAAESRRETILSAARVDFPTIAEQNGGAVTLIAVEWENGRAFTGSGFGVTRGGAVVTNRHLVQAASGETPRRIAIIYSDTKVWLPANVVTASEDADLALLQVALAGSYPTVRGIAPSAARITRGAPIAIIGYPLGVDTPMDGSGVHITARATLGAGTVGKLLGDVVQIDAYAGEGSSGSPVFDSRGDVIGVVFGGAKESAGRIVYAVPSEKLMAILPKEASRLLR